MFGFSFGEILIIAVIAVLFLGPDKLPQTFVDIVKFLKAVKKTINDAKDAIDREVHISEIKQEALEYKKKFEQGANDLTNSVNNNKSLNELSNILNSSLDNPSYSNNVQNTDSKEITMQDVEIQGKQIASKVNLKKKDEKHDSDIKDPAMSTEQSNV